MYAIIRQGDGAFYVSAVYGYYTDVTATDDYQRYLESIHKPYYIVWDSEKKRLIRWLAMEPNTHYIIPKILIIDSDHSDWNTNDEGEGCIDFLNRELLDSFLDNNIQQKEILEKCRIIDGNYTYQDIKEIKNKKDIEDLYQVASGFHDARIAKEEMLKDGSLHLIFDGIWGCNIEMWFWGDLEYDTESRNPEFEDPYWFDSTLIMQDGFIYLVDGEDMTVDEITSEYCYFKAIHMKYKIIPNQIFF